MDMRSKFLNERYNETFDATFDKQNLPTSLNSDGNSAIVFLKSSDAESHSRKNIILLINVSKDFG